MIIYIVDDGLGDFSLQSFDEKADDLKLIWPELDYYTSYFSVFYSVSRFS